MVKICGKQNVPPGNPNYDICIAAAESIVPETEYNLKPNVGRSNNYAREDHTHGTPSLHVSNATTQTLFSNVTDVTKDRAFDKVYQNTAGNPIIVSANYLCSISGGTTGAQAIIGSKNPPDIGVVGAGPFNSPNAIAIDLQLFFVVPAGFYYTVESRANGNSVTLLKWVEWS